MAFDYDYWLLQGKGGPYDDTPETEYEDVPCELCGGTGCDTIEAEPYLADDQYGPPRVRLVACDDCGGLGTTCKPVEYPEPYNTDWDV